MDNECSTELKLVFEHRKVAFQLVTPHSYRRNLAERSIQTFKNHFVAGLASVDPDFPLGEWDRLLKQAEITLNLLRGARMNPKLSAYAYSFGKFNYNTTPMVPLGTRVVENDTPSVRGTCDPHGQDGWTTGPSLEHYRLIKCYFPSTRAERNIQTATFSPKDIPFPKVNLDDFLRQAAMDIITILSSPPTNNSQSLEVGDTTKNALLKIAQILHRAEDLPQLPCLQSVPNVVKTNVASSKVQNAKNKHLQPTPSPRVLQKDTHMVRDSTNQAKVPPQIPCLQNLPTVSNINNGISPIVQRTKYLQPAPSPRVQRKDTNMVHDGM